MRLEKSARNIRNHLLDMKILKNFHLVKLLLKSNPIEMNRICLKFLKLLFLTSIAIFLYFGFIEYIFYNEEPNDVSIGSN